MTIFIPVGGLSRCFGQGHVNVVFSINGGPERTRTYAADQLTGELDDLTAEELIIARLRSACKEANATTAIQIRNALEGKTFEV